MATEDGSHELHEIGEAIVGLETSVAVVDESIVDDGDTIELLKESNATVSADVDEGRATSSSSVRPDTGDGGSALPEPNRCKRAVNLAALMFFATIGGFLFGYGTAIVSGAMILVDEAFDLSHLWHELIVSVAIGVAAVATIIGGVLADALGRKPVLIVSSVIFTVGTVLAAAAPVKEVLLVGRVVLGLSIGGWSSCRSHASHMQLGVWFACVLGTNCTCIIPRMSQVCMYP